MYIETAPLREAACRGKGSLAGGPEALILHVYSNKLVFDRERKQPNRPVAWSPPTAQPHPGFLENDGVKDGKGIANWVTTSLISRVTTSLFREK